jgi:hypothetical protein
MLNRRVRVSSEPAGALVMYSRDRPFDEKTAAVWGTTPLSRYVDAIEGVVRISKTGFDEWEGVLDEQHMTVNARLTPRRDEHGEWPVVESPPTDFLSVVPLRVGIQEIGQEGKPLDDSDESKTFRQEFVWKLSRELVKRFGRAAQVNKDVQLTPVAAQTVWSRLDDQMANVRVEKIGYYPQPVRVDVDTRALGIAAKAGAAVVLVRAEAYYLGTGTQIVRAAVPILLTAASAAGGAAVAASAGAPLYVYPVFGPITANEDAMIAEVYVVHPWTKELLWTGRAAARGHYTNSAVIEGVVTNLVNAIPSRFVGGVNDDATGNTSP